MSKNKVYSGIDRIPTGQASEVLVPGCLCLEGGAFRGVYGEGVLDAFMQQDLNFQTVIGVSAGALNGLNYVAGQIGRSARINLTYRHDNRYVGLEAHRRSNSLLNLDFLWREVNEVDPLDEERFYRPEQRYLAVAANCETGETEYFEKGICKDIMSAVKASASMPYLSPMIMVDGVPCLDGGSTCKIPYQWALDNGFEKIVVIRTRELAFRKKEHNRGTAMKYYKRFPEFAEKVDDSDAMYNRQCEELEQLQASGRIYMLSPSEPVTVGRVEPDMEKLGELYWLGYADAQQAIPAIREYLAR